MSIKSEIEYIVQKDFKRSSELMGLVCKRDEKMSRNDVLEIERNFDKLELIRKQFP